MKLLVTSLLLLSVVLTAQSQKRHITKYEYPYADQIKEEGYLTNGIKTGHWKYYYSKGKIKEEGDYINGLKTGVWISNKEFTDVRILANYYKDMLHGVWTYYYNGKLQTTGSYSYDKKDGEFVSYFDYAKGKVSTRGKFIEDKKDGTWVSYFKSGSLKSSENWNRGKIYGINKEYKQENGTHFLFSTLEYSQNDYRGKYCEYNSEGLMYLEGFYNAEKEKTGMWNYYYYYFGEGNPQNKLKEVQIYTNDKCEQTKYYYYYDDWSLRGTESYLGTLKGDYNKVGLWQFYYKNGNKRVSETWESGDRVGAYFEGYVNGNTKITGSYDERAEKTGIWKSYYENGQLESEGMYEGKQTGEWKFYYSNGKLKALKPYNKDGKLDGFCKYYSESGEISKSGSYSNGTALGVWTSYHKNGAVKEKGEYERGILNSALRTGNWEEFYDNGTIKTIKKYKYGELVGKVKAYDREGNKIAYVPDEQN